MNRKLVYAIALGLVFASAGAVSRSKSNIHLEYVPNPSGNGDYRLFIFASDRLLVCEEQQIKVVEQGDSLNPLVVECKHGGK